MTLTHVVEYLSVELSVPDLATFVSKKNVEQMLTEEPLYKVTTFFALIELVH